MNIVVVTDLHLSANKPAGRIGNYIADVDLKLEELIDISRGVDAEAVLCAGDVFHRPDPSFQVVSRFVSFLERLNLRFITITGSHDLFGNNLDALYRTAIGFLDRVGLIELLYPEVRPVTRVGDFVVGIAGSGVAGIELAHGNILPFPEFGGYTLLKDYNTRAKVVVVGHYHAGYDLKTIRDTSFVCPGAFVRTSAQVGEFTRLPRVAIVNDTYKVTWRKLNSAKPGTEVLVAPIVAKEVNFAELVRGWGGSKIENVDAVALLKEVAKEDKVTERVLKYSLSFLEEQRNGNRRSVS